MQPELDIFRHRFVCDVMLARLARYLRAAGYDTLVAEPQAPDAELVRRAVDENRWLITMDRQILEHKAGQGRVRLLPPGTVQEQAQWLAMDLGLDWLVQPFSRCLVDNSPLVVATSERVVQVPALVSRTTTDFMACPECGRVYWAGSHHRRMHATLTAWQSAANP
jgi:uncharacterized protein with PIN domain